MSVNIYLFLEALPRIFRLQYFETLTTNTFIMATDSKTSDWQYDYNK